VIERAVVPDLQQFIKRQIKLYIIDGGLRAGDRLPTEDELAGRLGVSRTVVREALSGLEALGIIEVRHGLGRYVREFNFSAILDNLAYSMLFDVHTFEEILDIRQALETAFLPRAIAALSTERLSAMEETLREMERRGAGGVWDVRMMELDMKFHAILYADVGNDLLLKLLDIFWTVHKDLRSHAPYETKDVPGYLRQHRALWEAIAQKNPELAQERLRTHFAGVREWISLEKQQA
jgi:DNA-binding FadR family transcriptional regulator